MGKYILFLVFQLIISQNGLCQNIDSLIKKAETFKSPEDKARVMMEITDYYFSAKENALAEEYTRKTENQLNKSDSILFKVDNLNRLGVLLRNNSKYNEALRVHKTALNIAEESGYKRGQTISLNNIGVVYRRIDNHASAAEYHTKALKVAEETKDTFSISVSYNSLGNIYSLNGRYDEALSFFNKALDLAIKQKNQLSQAINNNNIGEVYEFTGNYNKAKEYYLRSFEINQTLKNEKGIAISYNAIGKITLLNGDAKTALDYFSKALVIDQKLGDKKFIAESYLNIGRALIVLNRYNESINFLNKSIVIAKDIHSLVHLQSAYEALSTIYSIKNQDKEALSFYKIAALYKDSVLNEKSARHISTVQAVFESEKKEQQIKFLQQNQEQNAREFKKQRLINISLLISLGLSLIIIVLVYLAFTTKRNANYLLSKQNTEIESKNQALNRQKNEIQSQKEEIEIQRMNIEIKNKNLEDAYQIIENYIGKITDSIRYAEKIQKSIFPDLDGTNIFFKEQFIFYKPKDIVSGDFYWFSARKELLYFAIADCTGHGVPGAFMSIIGIDLLNQAINQQGLDDTSEILAFLNTELRRRLKKDKEEAVLKDSMDIALSVYNKSTGEITFSGALIPLFLLRNNTIDILKPDNTTLGMSTVLFNRNFNKQKTYLKKGDLIYLTTDGYLDQFGGDANKKFMRSRLFSLLLKIKDLPTDQQKEQIENTYMNWKGKNEQIDDVLVWGIKV